MTTTRNSGTTTTRVASTIPIAIATDASTINGTTIRTLRKVSTRQLAAGFDHSSRAWPVAVSTA